MGGLWHGFAQPFATHHCSTGTDALRGASGAVWPGFEKFSDFRGLHIDTCMDSLFNQRQLLEHLPGDPGALQVTTWADPHRDGAGFLWKDVEVAEKSYGS